MANRRGWLQSAGMLSVVLEGELQTTSAGAALMAELSLYEPSRPVGVGGGSLPQEPSYEEPKPEPPTPAAVSDAEELINALKVSATDSTHPDRFEQTVRDAFQFLGFRAEWLGGPGRTDVLLDAMLGRDDSYRVIVDCKTSAAGTVSDQQVDWITLGDHKVKHDAQYVALVAPNPSSSRLFERAETHQVTVISVEQFSGLCRLHAKTPIGLAEYRSLFMHGGSVDTSIVDERAEEIKRLTALAGAMCDAIRDRAAVFGRLSARDIFLLLDGNPLADGATEPELQELLSTLASPLIGVLDGTATTGYRVTTSPEVSRSRLSILAQQLGTH